MSIENLIRALLANGRRAILKLYVIDLYVTGIFIKKSRIWFLKKNNKLF